MADQYPGNADQVIGSTEIGLDVQHSVPPTQTYVGKDDSLWIGVATAVAALVVTVNARYLMPDGTIQLNQYTVRPAQSRAMAYSQIQLPECFLLSVGATSNSSPGGPGGVFIEIVLSRFAPSLFNAAQILAEGYSNFNQPISWPGGINSTSLDCAGTVYSTAPSLPAAGADWSLSVPANAKWSLITVFAHFLASATVATRTIELVIDDGGNPLQRIAVNTQPTAGQNWNISFGQGIAVSSTPAISNVCQPLPMGIKLMAGWRVRSITTNIQTTDQWSAIVLAVEEWITP